MRFNQIRDFLAVVDGGSIRAAARRLSLSQPALTKSLRQLERELGVVLLSRGVRGARPTEFGNVFLAHARAVDADLRRAREELERLKGTREGGLSIGSAPGPALGLLPEALARLRARWPQARLRVVDVTPSEVLPSLRDGSIELAVCARVEPVAGATAEFEAEPLYRNEAAIVARRGHPLARARRMSDLAEAEWIRSGYPADTSALPDRFRKAGLAPPRYRVECPSFLMVPEIVAQGDLLAVVPWQIAAREVRAGRLARIAIPNAIPARQICLYRRIDVPPTPIARDCVEFLRQIARRRRGRAAR
ncbi:MAG: LysR family transcriptional regulator [Burkholderiales bacterium]